MSSTKAFAHTASLYCGRTSSGMRGFRPFKICAIVPPRRRTRPSTERGLAGTPPGDARRAVPPDVSADLGAQALSVRSLIAERSPAASRRGHRETGHDRFRVVRKANAVDAVG